MQLSRGVKVSTAKQARWIEEVSKSYRGDEISQLNHLAIERCRDCDKKTIEISTDRLGIERCRGGVEIA